MLGTDLVRLVWEDDHGNWKVEVTVKRDDELVRGLDLGADPTISVRIERNDA
jgi:hypothetical protein